MSRYLDMIDDPSHVKKLTIAQLQELAGEIRHELITKLAPQGGHLASNLGVVELTIALHYVFSTPVDKFIWDVSHQTYVHKLLTGRKNRFATIRTTGGLSGFACPAESPHDCFGSGHAGTALSAALGFAVARDKLGTNENVIAIFGDAALTNGISFEALNNIATTTKRFIGILNDNAYSIDRNVGAIARYLNKLITHPSFNRLQRDLERLLKRMPKSEITLKLRHKAEEALKGVVSQASLKQAPEEREDEFDGRAGYGSSLIFEEMGLRYLGPIDGHNLPLLIDTFEFAKSCDQPIVLHLVTQKGKGYDAAIQSPEKFHGIGPYDIKTGDAIKPAPGTPPTYQEIFGETVVRLCERDTKLVGITAAMPSGTGLKALAKRFPDKYYDVGIAEEHAVIFAAGMAARGFHPIVAIYSTFTQRAYDCIIHDVALQKLPVILCMDRAGLSASDGPTHHGLFDVSFLRCVPNLIFMAPKDEDEFVDMLFTATQQSLPVCIRYPRGPAEGVKIKDKPELLQIGKAEVIKSWTPTTRRFQTSDSANNVGVVSGSLKVLLIPLGNMMSLGRKTAKLLEEQGYDTAIINPRFIKPLDAATITYYAQSADAIITFEDNVIAGGFGSAVMELLSEQKIFTPLIRIGWPDQFIEHADSNEYLRQKYGITPEVAFEKLKDLFAQPESKHKFQVV